MDAVEQQTNTSSAVDQPNVILSERRRWAVTVGVLLGMALAALEATVVGTAMPTIIAKLGGIDRYSWVFSAYLLTSTVTVPVWGRLSDLFGRRQPYLLGVFFFLLGSALSGASQSITQLIIFRAVQGLGAGALIPLSMTINGDIFTLGERARMQGLFSGVWGLASILGPLAGGFITDNLSWQWVFYINIPFGLAAAIVVGIALKEPKRTKKPIVDYAGVFWLATGITILLLVLVESAELAVWKSPWMFAGIVSILFCSILFIRTERRAAEPIVPLELFRNRVITSGSIISFLLGASMFGVISFVPLFVQGTMGGSATDAGKMLTPFLLSWVTMAVVGGRLMLKVGYRPTVLAGLSLIAISSIILANFNQSTRQWMLLVDVAVMGCGMGLVNLVLLITMQNAVSRHQLGIATSLNQFSRSIGQTVGIAALGAVMTFSLLLHVSELQAASGLPEAEVEKWLHNLNALIEPGMRSEVPPELMNGLRSVLGGALHNVFTVGAILSVFGVGAGLWLPKMRAMLPPPQKEAVDKAAGSAAECERVLIAEMATLDPENEPAAVEDLTQKKV